MRLPDVGTQFQSRYRLDAILGAGGFATVYQAMDTLADRTVALKVLKPELTGYPPDVRSRFDQEVQMVANLRDEHTITLFDFGTSTDGLLFMVTEFVPGEDVSELLKRRERLEPDEVIHILMQVLQSLREAHALGLLHRDIKPANIRVFEYAGDPLCVRVLDFGIAKRMGKDAAGITKDGAIIGTPRYMSPEQLLQDDLTPSSDIYSLGVVAFELLMGSSRIHGTQLADQLSRLVTGHVFSIPELQRIGPDFCRILDRMTARDPGARFRTADEVYGALKALRGPEYRGSSDMIPVSPHHTPQSGLVPPGFGPDTGRSAVRPPTSGFVPQTGSHERPIRPPPSTGTMTVEQQVKANPRLIAGFVGLVGLLVLAAVGALLLSQRAEPEAPRPPTVREVPPTSILRPNNDEIEPVVEIEAPTPPTVAARLASPGCNRTAPFHGLSDLSVTMGLEMRSTKAFIPANYDPSHAHALFVLLHGDAEGAADFISYSELASPANEHGAVLIAPNGGSPYAWDAPAKWMGNVERAIHDAREELCIDPERVYLVGHSAGGKQAQVAACDLPLVRGIATTSYRGARADPQTCSEAAEPVPHIHIAPLKDRYNPVKGGKGCSGVVKISLTEKEEIWKTRNGCSGKRKTWTENAHGTCYTWDCEAAFVSCHVKGGRNWDGYPGKRLWDHNNCDGPPSQFPYAETIWKFFEEFGTK